MQQDSLLKRYASSGALCHLKIPCPAWFERGNAALPIVCATDYVYFPGQRPLVSMQKHAVRIHSGPRASPISSGLGKMLWQLKPIYACEPPHTSRLICVDFNSLVFSVYRNVHLKVSNEIIERPEHVM